MSKRYFGILKHHTVESYIARNNLDNLMNKKEVLLNKSFVYSSNLDVVLDNSVIFIKTSKLIKFRRLLSINKNFKVSKNKGSFFFNIKVANGFINKSLVESDYNFFLRYQQSIFSKNFNLFLDFIKVTNLLCQNILDLKIFVHLLGSLFRMLHKRQHNRFLVFVSSLFKYILNTYPNVCGLRLEISGRLLGKPRASTKKIEHGFLGSNSFSENKYSFQMHVYTLYGAFGLKCSVNFKK
jgi:hypothetical protein